MKIARLLASATLSTILVGSLCLAVETATPGNQDLKGKIIETMNSSGYTYVKLDSGDRQVWAAIPETKVQVGQEVVLTGGMVMENFESKTLNRSFDSIVFSPGIQGTAMASPHSANKQKPADDDFNAALKAETGTSPHSAPVDDPAAMQSAGSAGAIVPSMDVQIDKVAGENGYTVGEIFEKRKDLDGKTARVRGKVVKITSMIMGKNWIHLQDGSGNPMHNSHDLVATTMATPAKDAIVVVEGTVHADKDFGAGYRYDVIIEEASVQ